MAEIARIATTAERLREAMALSGKRQLDLANGAELSHSTISRYLSGQMEPKQKAISRLAIILNVSEMWLWGYDVPISRSPEQKKNDAIIGAVSRMRNDPEFLDVVSLIAELPSEQYASIKTLLTALSKK